MQSRTIEQVLGDNARKIRRHHGLTLDEVVQQLRVLGLNWSTGRIGVIEAGRGTAGVQVVFCMSLALTNAIWERSKVDRTQEVKPQDLLTSDTPVAVTPTYVLSAEGFAKLASGEGVSAFDMAGDLTKATGQLDDIAQIEGYGDRYGFTVKEMADGLQRMTLADERAATKLGLTSVQFVGESLALWGHLMSQEVDARAPEDATAQKRGHETRKLLAELREHLG